MLASFVRVPRWALKCYFDNTGVVKTKMSLASLLGQDAAVRDRNWGENVSMYPSCLMFCVGPLVANSEPLLQSWSSLMPHEQAGE